MARKKTEANGEGTTAEAVNTTTMINNDPPVSRPMKEVSFKLSKAEYELLEVIALSAGKTRQVKKAKGGEITKGDVSEYFKDIAAKKVKGSKEKAKKALQDRIAELKKQLESM